MNYVYLISALVLNAAANVLLKVGSTGRFAKTVTPDAGFGEKLVAFLNWPTLLGIFLFAANVIPYRKSLEGFDLTVAYPIMVSGSLIISTLAVWMIPMIGEHFSALRIAGIGVIIAGIWMVVS
jgi:multidrug transporter EmrE-like cation transporter